MSNGKSYEIRTFHDIAARVLDAETRDELLEDFAHWLDDLKTKSIKLNEMADATLAKTGKRPRIDAKLRLTYTCNGKGIHIDDTKIVARGLPTDVVLR
jgi:hypothetical protein